MFKRLIAFFRPFRALDENLDGIGRVMCTIANGFNNVREEMAKVAAEQHRMHAKIEALKAFQSTMETAE